MFVLLEVSVGSGTRAASRSWSSSFSLLNSAGTIISSDPGVVFWPRRCRWGWSHVVRSARPTRRRCGRRETREKSSVTTAQGRAAAVDQPDRRCPLAFSPAMEEGSRWGTSYKWSVCLCLFIQDVLVVSERTSTLKCGLKASVLAQVTIPSILASIQF